MLNEFYDDSRTDEISDNSMQFNYIEATEAAELQEDSVENTDLKLEQSEKDHEISELEHQYEQAKLCIEMSRTKDEQDYWIKRGDELWNKRDIASAEYKQAKV